MDEADRLCDRIAIVDKGQARRARHAARAQGRRARVRARSRRSSSTRRPRSGRQQLLALRRRRVGARARRRHAGGSSPMDAGRAAMALADARAGARRGDAIAVGDDRRRWTTCSCTTPDTACGRGAAAAPAPSHPLAREGPMNRRALRDRRARAAQVHPHADDPVHDAAHAADAARRARQRVRRTDRRISRSPSSTRTAVRRRGACARRCTRSRGTATCCARCRTTTERDAAEAVRHGEVQGALVIPRAVLATRVRWRTAARRAAARQHGQRRERHAARARGGRGAACGARRAGAAHERRRRRWSRWSSTRTSRTCATCCPASSRSGCSCRR